jgi:hypothetical protein
MLAWGFRHDALTSDAVDRRSRRSGILSGRELGAWPSEDGEHCGDADECYRLLLLDGIDRRPNRCRPLVGMRFGPDGFEPGRLIAGRY